MKPERIIFLDYIRAIAIVLVIIGHFRHFFIPNFSGENKLLFFVTSFGHFGVVLFFGLSGILAHKRIKSIFQWKDVLNYLKLRLTRIYLVLPFALILTFILDYIALALGLYVDIESYEIISQTSSPNARLSFSNFIFNLISLQTLFFDFFGSNGPLWSLSYEVWFYILGAFLKKTRFFILIILFGIIDLDFIIYFVFWYSIGYIKIPKTTFIYFVISTIVLISAHIYKPIFLEIIYCLYFIVFYSFMKQLNLPKLYFVSFFAKISYSLYIFHYPILLFLSFYLFGEEIKNFNYYQMIIISSSVILLCYLLYNCFENSKLSNNIMWKIREKIKS